MIFQISWAAPVGQGLCGFDLNLPYRMLYLAAMVISDLARIYILAYVNKVNT